MSHHCNCSQTIIINMLGFVMIVIIVLIRMLSRCDGCHRHIKLCDVLHLHSALSIASEALFVNHLSSFSLPSKVAPGNASRVLNTTHYVRCHYCHMQELNPFDVVGQPARLTLPYITLHYKLTVSLKIPL